ncbi:MAG: radical SAM protein, partial [Candidatus Omnitrophota bacterium]
MTKNVPQLLISDLKGRIYNIESMRAAGMKGGCFFPLSAEELIKLPSGSELFRLPQRAPVGYTRETGSLDVLSANPLTKKKEPCFAVAAFISPGFTAAFNTAYRELPKAKCLPLFSYAACTFYK